MERRSKFDKCYYEDKYIVNFHVLEKNILTPNSVELIYKGNSIGSFGSRIRRIYLSRYAGNFFIDRNSKNEFIYFLKEDGKFVMIGYHNPSPTKVYWETRDQ